MKKVLFFSVLAFCLVACNNNKKADQTDQMTEEVTAKADIPAFELDDLLKVADQYVDKSIKVRGYVTHTCKHSGKRCFIQGDEKQVTMRIEAGGEIGGFNKELVGSKIETAGTLKEKRLTKEYIDQWEKETNEKKAKEDGSAETCVAELNNIKEMRDWMKENGKDYYSIFYLDGEKYETVE